MNDIADNSDSGVEKSPAKSILVVEDEKALAKALQAKLAKRGYEVKIAFNGKTAIEEVGAKKFDLMLLDILMPVTDGFEVLTTLKEKNIKVPPVIVTSNLSQKEDIQKIKELGAVDFLVKSNTTLEEIVDAVELYLKK